LCRRHSRRVGKKIGEGGRWGERRSPPTGVRVVVEVAALKVRVSEVRVRGSRPSMSDELRKREIGGAI
jgi:hypothetical protein